jgi:hypothetical protein
LLLVLEWFAANEQYIQPIVFCPPALIQMREQILALVPQWQVDFVVVEDTSSGMGLLQPLREDPHLDVAGRRPDADKETRIRRQQGRFEAGRILTREDDLWPWPRDPWPLDWSPPPGF